MASAELYNLATGMWTTTGSMQTSRAAFTATLLPTGDVLITGGEDEAYHTLSSAELYNPATGTWTLTGSMSVAREHHTATLLTNGKVLVTGGTSDGSTTLSSAEIYDPSTGTWAKTGSMPTPRASHTATRLWNGSVLVAGGTNGVNGAANLASADLYDPRTGIWTATGSMTTGRLGATATLLPNGTVLVAGGSTFAYYPNPTPRADVYIPRTGTWTATGAMGTARVGQAAILLPTGQVLVSGGCCDDQGQAWASAELYDPASGVWTPAGRMSTARAVQTITLLANGQALVTGGCTVQWCTDQTGTAELFTPLHLVIWPRIARIQQTVTVMGSGFLGDEPIRLAWDGVSGEAAITATAAGTFAATFPIPPTVVGRHTVSAVGQISHTAAFGFLQVNPRLPSR